MGSHGGFDTIRENGLRARFILGLAIVSAILYAGLAAAGDLRVHLPLLLSCHAALTVAMVLAWRRVRRDRSGLRWILIAALVFRLIAAFAPPTLSDDVYRYVWDGRVQLHGVHPYRYAPADPALEPLRDESWERINHPDLKTVYPPLAQMVFLFLAAVGAGPLGFKLLMGGLDFGVVLALGLLLRKLRLPPDRVVFYAWNPLAVLESAGSGHVEPLGVLLVVLAAGWIIDRRPRLATLALAGGIQAKILPVALLPGHARRVGWRGVALLALALVALALPYLATGPPLGTGLVDYAERWERNGVLFPAVRQVVEWLDLAPRLKNGIGALQRSWGEGRVPWDSLYRRVWPPYTARMIVAAAALGWVLLLAFRRRLDATRETFLVLAGLLLLSPTLHAWYLLWILPFAAAYRSWGWLCLASLVPLSYLGGDADVPWLVRTLEYGPPLVVAVGLRWAAARRRRTAPGNAGA